jgi:hypothetical protein
MSEGSNNTTLYIIIAAVVVLILIGSSSAAGAGIFILSNKTTSAGVTNAGDFNIQAPNQQPIPMGNIAGGGGVVFDNTGAIKNGNVSGALTADSGNTTNNNQNNTKVGFLGGAG